ncbi:CHAP domain-containing protein [Allobranchiibius huperziae]|uniref:Peptidase C51 domain-containing protein n=1 Tax=Allobranchiibius huperziae TaxID=1874116 RepID=A0A853DD20_9MICO|nr:CHAP domain-containing protein [Allobranchiibius huperziae]NYJ74788.1 hypothetical protein [Allobranchiibius huperziae]
MSPTPPRSRGRSVLVAATLIVALLVGAGGYVGWRALNPGRGSFPTVASDLTPRQRSILTVARTEWEHPGPSTKYSNGIDENWCSDFVSWVLRHAGYPMSNPNSGSWRIPGVLTLQSYLTKAGRFRAVGDGYAPQPGDIVIYDGGGFGQHTNLVVEVRGHTIETVGGNQGAGLGRHGITVRQSLLNGTGVVGYGVA